ncbi:type II and III secretion system protein [Candidatus Synchoanobacter obligatus]|uniref:Type II and III secretion system protein n=1 Tax=Candidatus Synchoanobacter obligatus TaxID=2919597 RepID=A0ABT1L4W2_9GAMM|nr:type II and III secretion system protein [Candidatus Synchoanobacter obligatus]MCP8352214.1 type II and III secretion system protein [Candidatus Synchoanobacter obligatus]
MMISGQATLFGPKWLHIEKGQVSVQANGIVISGLLNEWCQVCDKQCVVDHEIKSKLSLNIPRMTCEDLYMVLTKGVEVTTLADTLVFSKPAKGTWVPYPCSFRRPEEMAAKLKALLSPMGKYDHILADNVSGMLWVPKGFYDQHQAMIEAIDQPKKYYNVYLSWFRVDESAHWESMNHPWEEVLLRLWQGQAVNVSIEDLVRWLQRSDSRGSYTFLSDFSSAVVEGEAVEVVLEEVIQRTKRDKKGVPQWVDVPQGVMVNMTLHSQQDKVAIHIDLQDKLFDKSTEGYKQSMIQLNTVVEMEAGMSKMLSGFSRQEAVHKKQCTRPLSALPVIGRLFCHKTKVTEERQYALVIAVHEEPSMEH